MSAQIIDGKAVAENLRESIRQAVEERINNGLRRPGLAVILVGDNPASQVYVRNKKLACEKAGITSFEHTPPADISEADLLALIHELNNDDRVDGILVQLPLPAHIDEESVIETISPDKDVDGFHPYNIGRLMIGKPTFRPCTPQGVTRLLETTGVDITGNDAVIVGRSNIVGRPMAFELLAKDCTPKICHSRSKDLPAQIKQADIVVAAIGKPGFIQAHWIKPGAIVIDVGINRLESGKLTGDVDFEAAKEVAGYITPVPGGVGPMTIACLLENTLESARNRD
ncbi:MAG: bifunctional methylenetetrahydrofolate dehydrogenase/methenyltetrahydrofolate cyclohydrolase FolD [Gammaproteobacteria bacterium]|nr:bifunctional methylenetetrahydrofolate dehydrogenase/methenyltetrahydrofolate cyclohydrolase FolD [Gammaproteobacteria bacterium]